MKSLFVVLFLFCTAGAVYAFDHDYPAFAELLQKHVHDGKVSYSTLKKQQVDAMLQPFRSLGGHEYGAFTREQQLAFWINAYNAWMIAIVADHYPIQGNKKEYPSNSVQQIDGIWDKLPLQAAGKQVSLNQIEHEILRKQFREPRIHFALVCASAGCPNLANEPYRASTLDTQLENAARAFLSDTSKVRLIVATRELQLSSIFQWFSGDFSSFADEVWRERYQEYAGVVAFIAGRLAQQEKKILLRSGEVHLQWLSYDWTLNEQR